MVDIKSVYYKENGNSKYDSEISDRIENIINTIEKEKNVFPGKKDRLYTAAVAVLITVDDKDAGFIYATCENRYSKGLFIDMALLKEYRGLGYGKEALNQFVKRVNTGNVYLFGEIESTNVASNAIADHIGIKIIDNDKNYYLFPKERLAEFLEKEDINILRHALSIRAKTSRELLIEAYEAYNEDDRVKVKTRTRRA